MPTITFRVTEEEKNYLEKIADFNKLSLSDFVRQNAMHAAEDQMDFQTYHQLIKEHQKQDQSISHEALMKELNL